MKLLHISDIHFGAKFLNKDKKVREILINESYTTFDNAIKFILNNNIKGLLIAGDMFDGDYRSLRAEKYLIDAFEKLKNYNVKVFYCLGNHDSNITFKNGFLRQLPSNVIIFNEEKPSSYLLEDTVYIHSCGHQTGTEGRNLVSDFPKYIKNYYNVGLLHCSIVSTLTDHENYLPTRIEDLQGKGYDYWALGHIHKRKKVTDNIFYSGSLYGLSSKETGNKGGLIINFDNNETSVEFINLSSINYETVIVDFERELIKDQYELLKYLDKIIESLNKKIMLKLNFLGQTTLYEFFNQAENINELKDEIKRKRKIIDIEFNLDGLKRNINYEDYIRKDNILGYIQKYLENEEFRSQLIEEYNLDTIDEKFTKELMNMMVGAENED